MCTITGYKYTVNGSEQQSSTCTARNTDTIAINVSVSITNAEKNTPVRAYANIRNNGLISQYKSPLKRITTLNDTFTITLSSSDYSSPGTYTITNAGLLQRDYAIEVRSWSWRRTNPNYSDLCEFNVTLYNYVTNETWTMISASFIPCAAENDPDLFMKNFAKYENGVFMHNGIIYWSDGTTRPVNETEICRSTTPSGCNSLSIVGDTPEQRYNCVSNVCTSAANGIYANYTECRNSGCETQAQQRYNCVSNVCTSAANGIYANYTECRNSGCETTSDSPCNSGEIQLFGKCLPTSTLVIAGAGFIGLMMMMKK